jgi:7-carboxy-7-deazaguanine synthase
MKIAEIFASIHGEINGHTQGRMVTFIRISGCSLQCPWCDTAHTQDPNYGTEMSVMQILSRAKELKNKYICITGGEPLLNKKNALELIEWLWKEKFHISIETNGTVDITPFYRYVESFVIDYKVGIKNFKSKMVLTNYLSLGKKDVIKFVVNKDTIQESIEQYRFLKSFYLNNSWEPTFAFSPIISKDFTAKYLYNYLRNSDIHDVVISVQLHKLVGFN